MFHAEFFLNVSNLAGENTVVFFRYTMSGQNAPMRSQYQSMNEIGSLHSRSAGFKHQGGGCALGSFAQTLNTSWGGGGRGRGGERKRSRSGGQSTGRVSFECSQVAPARRSETSPSWRIFVGWILCCVALWASAYVRSCCFRSVPFYL